MQVGVGSATAVENKRVFIVDSDEIIRAVLQFMLHDEYEAHEFATPAAAVAKGIDWKPDLLVLGGATLRELGLADLPQIKSELGGVKILLVTEAGENVVAQAALDAGVADALLLQPLTVESVRRTVNRLCGRRTQRTVKLHQI